MRELQIKTNDIESIKENVENYKEVIKSLTFNNNIDELKENKKELKKLIADIKKVRDEYFNAMDSEKKNIISLENLIKDKTKEIDAIAEDILKEEKEIKYKDCLNYFNENKGVIFDFIDFKKDIFEKTMINSNIYTSKGKLNKKITDIINTKIDKFNQDKLLIDGDSTVLSIYKNNGYDVSSAILNVKELREQEEINNAKKLEDVKKREIEAEVKIQEADAKIEDAKIEVEELKEVIKSQPELDDEYINILIKKQYKNKVKILFENNGIEFRGNLEEIELW